jgi:DUF4097 and DUF4098 domain-containing protein YvlB
MFRTAALAGVLCLALGPTSDIPSAAQTRGRVTLDAADCSSINMMFGDYEVGRAVQHTTVPVAGAPLELRPGGNGGVRVERSTGGAYEITACIGVGARTAAEAQAVADSIRLVVEGNKVRLSGTGENNRVRSWSVQLIVAAPDGASIDAETANGPIGVDDVDGTFALRASNGPISLHGVTGDVKARAVNGPISVTGSRGQFDVETSNGPITVRLDGQRWDGRLDARASNGPLTVTLPPDYQSGVEISSSQSSPWNCRAAACRSGNRDWDERARTLRIGGDPIVVRISTVNGPVTVNER